MSTEEQVKQPDQEAATETDTAESQTGENGTDSPAGGANSQVQELEAKAKEWEEKYLYLYAEFENFRKRIAKEKQDFFKFGHEDFIRELLMVQDNFDRALQCSQGSENAETKQIVDGIKMIMQQFADTLKHQGVLPIKTVGEKFDPNLHEAISEEVSDKEPGTILTEHLAGYTLHSRLLRAAKVVTAKK